MPTADHYRRAKLTDGEWRLRFATHGPGGPVRGVHTFHGRNPAARASRSEANVTRWPALILLPGGQLERQNICVVVQPLNIVGPL